MQSASAGAVTRLLHAWSDGHPDAQDELLPLVYGELRRRAAGHLRRDRRHHTLQPTALVHEAYMRLLGQHAVDWQSRTHFFALASRMMRRILVDHARARAAAKRPDEALRVALEGDLASVDPRGCDVLLLDQALTELARLDERQGADRRAVLLRRPHRNGVRGRPVGLAIDGRERAQKRQSLAATAA